MVPTYPTNAITNLLIDAHMIKIFYKKQYLDAGLPLHIEEQVGAGQPVVFLHGLGGTNRYWTCQLKQEPLAGRALFVDLLGFGNSPQPWCQYTIERHLAALDAALSHHESFSLVGHSLGAALALLYAARFPEKVKSLVLISLPCFETKEQAYDWMRRTPSGWIFTNMLIAGFACIVTRRVAGKLLPFFLADYPKEVAEDVVKHNVMSSITSLWNILYRRDLRRDAAGIAPGVPVLCIHAVDDDTAPYAPVDAIAKELPSWHLLHLEGSRHHPWLWDTAACRRAMDAFLAQLQHPPAPRLAPDAVIEK